MAKQEKVWVIDNEGLKHDKAFELYREWNIDYRLTTDETLEHDLAEFGRYARAVVIDVNFLCTAAFINRLEHCNVICTFSMGVNHIDLEAASQRNIDVCNVPDYCREEVSDHTLALSLALLRRLGGYDRKVKSGVWDPLDIQPIRRINQLTVGLLGFGQIARMVAEKFHAFGVRVIANDRFVGEDIFKRYGVTPVSLEELLHTSQVLSLHVPLTNETENLLHEENMRKLPHGATIINTCRGGIIDEEALAQLIEEGHIAGAGIDVFKQEPPREDHPLLSLENTIITPHAAFYSVEAEEQMQTDTAENVIRAIQGKKPHHIVHPIGEST